MGLVGAYDDERLASAAVRALVAEAELAPRAGAVREDVTAVRWAARALKPGFAAMAAAARRNAGPTRALREELGFIGRATERSMLRATGGVNTHRGCIWSMGLLVAATALKAGASPQPGSPLQHGASIHGASIHGASIHGAPILGASIGELTDTAKALAALRDRSAPRLPSPGSTVSARYGAAGARGEARAGFPHVRRALAALRAGTGRPDVLLSTMSTLQDTGILYAAGPRGLRAVQAGAREILDAGGTTTPEGAAALVSFDAELRGGDLRPRGSAALLACGIFLDDVASTWPAKTRPTDASSGRGDGRATLTSGT
ncbi:triphosphoribosyl-dephospho-CoA synthase [Streptomyces sp. NPDC047197]|uniref:triphosphoribosyl-dephospho-CoA synthase n=1 Tax=Streptomyces sp. NPDC047197 TaxID=3155477 RepID=UPI00340BBB07